FQANIGLLFAGSLSSAEATSDQTVRAFFGDKAVANAGTHPVMVTGSATVSAIADITGFGVGAIAAGVSTVTAELEPSLGAFTVGGGSITGGDVTFKSRLNVTDAGVPIKPSYDQPGPAGTTTVDPAYAHVFLASVGVIAGIAAADVTSRYSPT